MDLEDRARYSADLGRSAFAAGPPGHGEIERIRNVLVIAGDPTVDQGDTDDLIMLPRWEGSPATGRWKEPEPIELGRGLRIEHLDGDEAERMGGIGLLGCGAARHKADAEGAAPALE